MKWLRLLVIVLGCALPASAQLSLIDAGSGTNEVVTITSTINNAPQFRLVFTAFDNWGIEQWYDMVNDPNATTNLLYANNGTGCPPVPSDHVQNGIANVILYGDNDEKFWGQCVAAGATFSIITNTPTLMVVQGASSPFTNTTVDTNVTLTNTYYIYSNGEIYVHQALHVVNAQNLTSNGSGNFVVDTGLNDPSVPSGGSAGGWIRATNTENPYTYAFPWEHHMFAYWNPSDSLNPNFTKASIVVVPGSTARTLWGTTGGHITHSFNCNGSNGGVACGVSRIGFYEGISSVLNMSMGQTVQWDDLYQLGTQGSSYLPNLTTTTIPDLIYSPYTSPPTLTLTNATGGTWTVQGGYWTVARTSDPVTISANAGLYNPAYLVSGWANGLPSTITVNGVTKNLGVDYSASKYDTTHLIIQYLDGSIPSGQNVVLSMPAQGNPVLSPSPAVAFAGQAITINVTANPGSSGTWSCTATDASGNSQTCRGTLSGNTNTSVVYTAAATTITPQSYIDGFQFLPNNHVYNTRVDGLSTCAGSAACNNSTTAQLMGSVGTASVNFLGGTSAIVTAKNLTPLDNMSFYYTPGNNGVFDSPQFPNTAGMQNDWYDARQNNSGRDHHITTINKDSGKLGERYQYYCRLATATASVNGSNTATITFASDPIFGANPKTCGFYNGQSVCVGSFTGADTYFNVCPVTITAITSTSISFALTHALASASTNGSVTSNVQGGTCSAAGTCNSQSGIIYTVNDYPVPSISTSASGMQIEPAFLHFHEFEEACINSGTINHALGMTLSNGYIAFPGVFSWPAQTASSAGNVAGLSYYGERFRLKSSFNISGFSACAQIILTAFKNYGLILQDGGINWQISEDGPWTPTYLAYLTEINSANIATTNWEVVDESSLEVSASSGETTRNQEDVVFTRNDSVTATQPITLQGVAVDVCDDQIITMAGTPAQTLCVYINGASNLGVTWSISPTVGSIVAATGVYTPPANQASPTNIRATVCSTANSARCSHMTIFIFPGLADAHSGIRIMPAWNPSEHGGSGTYTDSNGNVWFGQFGLGLSNIPGNEGCCNNDGSFPNITDATLWNNHLTSSFSFGDYFFNQFRVPQGKYLVTYNNGTSLAAGANSVNFGAQGIQFAGPVDETTAVGLHQPYTTGTTVTVASDNKLSLYNVDIGRQSWGSGDVSSISITPITVTGSVVTPNSAVAKGTSIQ